MYKPLIFTVVGLCTLLVAKCSDEFMKEWKEYMDDKYCKTDNEESKEKVLKCTDMFPDKMKEIAMEKTGKSNMGEAMDELCGNEEIAGEVCHEIKKEMKENEEEMSMDEEQMAELKECMKQ